jgi:hypothetical protein
MAVRGYAWRAAINFGGDCVPHHARVHLSDVDATGVGEVAQTAGGAAPVHLPLATQARQRAARSPGALETAY